MKSPISLIVAICMVTALIPQLVFAVPATSVSLNSKHRQTPYKKYEAPRADDSVTTNIPTKLPDRDVPGHYTFWSTHEYDPSIPFNQNDVDTMRRFFEIEVDGKTNGYRNNGTYYNKDDVLTWKGPWWNIRKVNNVDTYVITALALAANWFYDGFPDIDTYDMRGAADFSGMEYVAAIYMNDTGRFDSIKADNCPALGVLKTSRNVLYGELSYQNCPMMTELYVSDMGLDSLDLSIVPNIEILNCGYNNLTKLDLEYIPKVSTLDCEYNKLTALDLCFTPNVAILNCSGNPLYSLDLTDLELWILDCSNCNLYELYLPLHSPYEMGVTCRNNYLTELDTSGVFSLFGLCCENNYITELDFKDNALLHSLRCSGNPIKKLDCSMLLSITAIWCEDMGLEELVLPKRNTALETLECSGNNLTHLDLRFAPVLQRLECNNNKITEIDLSSQSAFYTIEGDLVKSLQAFSCIGNPTEKITNIPLIVNSQKVEDTENHFVTLERSGAGSINVYYTSTTYDNADPDYYLHAVADPFSTEKFLGWYDGDTLISDKKEIELNNSSPANITAKFTGTVPASYTPPTHNLVPHAKRVMFENASYISLYDAHDMEKLRTFLETEDASGVKNGTKLNAKYSPDDISTWDFSCWKEVGGKLRLRLLIMDTRMDRDGKMHESVPLAGKIDLSGCDELRLVTCPDGNITEVDFSGCKKLITASFYNNPELAKANFKNCDNLSVVNLHDCAFTQFEFSDSMYYVSLRNNKLTKMNVGNPEKLEKFDVRNNELTELMFPDKINNMRVLLCSHNKLTELCVDTCFDLEYFDCSYNELTKLVTFGNRYWCDPYALDCSYNKLTEIDFWGSNLWVLHIDHNNIKRDVLGDMPNLMELTVSYNEIKKLDLTNTPYLCALDCSHCKCKDIDFGSYNQIVVLHCNDNELESLKIPGGGGVYLSKLSDLDCSNNKLTEIDLTHAGANMYSLNLSGNPLTTIKNAPVRYDLCMPFVNIYQPNIHINIQTQGAGTLDYDLDTITAIGDDFAGFYTGGTKLTSKKTLPTDDLESCTITAQFGAFSTGDVNMDGTVNTGDAVVVLKHSAEIIQLSDEQKVLADCNHDGNVNTGDAVLILKYAAGMITAF